MNLSISKINYAELDKVSLLKPEGWTDIIPAFKFYCTSDFCFPFKLNDGKEIIGSGCAVILDKTAWLGHIIVHHGFRRKGFGSMIVSETPDCEILPFNEKYRDEIYSLDETASGENRLSVIKNKLSESFICIKRGTLSGYYIPSLAEGLITAVDAVSGISLLKYKNPERFTVPEVNTTAINYALSHGFKEQYKLSRMFFGKHLNRNPEYIYSRISGFLG